MLVCCFGKTRLSFHDSRLYVLFHIYIYTLLYWRWKAENLWLCFFFGYKFIIDGLLWQVLCFKISPPYYWILKHSRTQLICLLRDTKAKTFQLLQVKKQKTKLTRKTERPHFCLLFLFFSFVNFHSVWGVIRRSDFGPFNNWSWVQGGGVLLLWEQNAPLPKFLVVFFSFLFLFMTGFLMGSFNAKWKWLFVCMWCLVFLSSFLFAFFLLESDFLFD